MFRQRSCLTRAAWMSRRRCLNTYQDWRLKARALDKVLRTASPWILYGGRLPLIHGLCLDDFLLPLSLTLALSYIVAYNMCKGREVLRLWEINVDLHLKEGRFAGPMLCQIAQASLRNVAAICSWIIDIIQRTAASAMSRHLSLCTFFKSTICAVMVDTLKH